MGDMNNHWPVELDDDFEDDESEPCGCAPTVHHHHPPVESDLGQFQRTLRTERIAGTVCYVFTILCLTAIVIMILSRIRPG